MRGCLLLLILFVGVATVAVLAFGGVAFAAIFPDLGADVLGGYGLVEIQVRGMSQGYDDGLWRPHNELTRKQFVKMAVDEFGIPLSNPTTPSFADVPTTDQYYQHIEGAVAAGLVRGVGNDLFAPLRSITREEAAAVLVRWVAGMLGPEPNAKPVTRITAALAQFEDAAQVSASLHPEVAKAVELGLLQGSGSHLYPRRPLLRIEGAALLARCSFVLGSTYVSDLQPLNGSGVTGSALLMLDEDRLRVLVLAEGEEPNREHAQHIHGLGHGDQSTVPPVSADTDHDGVISLLEGFPFYGKVLLALDEPFPIASSSGIVFYSHWFDGGSLDPLLVSTVLLTKRMIVLQGMTVGEQYDATIPVACGVITALVPTSRADSPQRVTALR
jgi:hypothetical protein